jgi:hypothetical protein
MSTTRQLCTSLFLTLVLLFLLLILPEYAGAQGKFVPLSVDKGTSVSVAPFMTDAFNSSDGLVPFVNAMFKAALAIGAMLAVLQLARAGIYYMGSDVWARKEQGKQLMRDALIGLLILLGIWMILNQINPQLLNLEILQKIDPGAIKGVAPAAASKTPPTGPPTTYTGPPVGVPKTSNVYDIYPPGDAFSKRVEDQHFVTPTGPGVFVFQDGKKNDSSVLPALDQFRNSCSSAGGSVGVSNFGEGGVPYIMHICYR